MDKMLTIIIIFLAVSFLMAAILAMGAIPAIFQTKQETVNQTEIIIKQFERENNITNKSINLLTTIINNQATTREDRDKKNEDIMIILALLNHETRQLIKLGLDEQNITNYHDPNFLNKRHTDYPHYYTNHSHVTIELNDTSNRTIPIPYEMSNLLMQFDVLNTTKVITKK